MGKRISLPETYWPKLDVMQTERAIWLLRETFEKEFGARLNLTKVQAPLIVRPETGLNDDLNGVEHPADILLKGDRISVQVVQSLAKWKRLALKMYGLKPHTGIFTNMIAVRPDEKTDPLHSVTVDQWDWESIVLEKERTLSTLQSAAEKIIESLYKTQQAVANEYPQLRRFINPDVFCITTQKLENLYPDLSPEEREERICREHKTVLLLQIGGNLKSGRSHDGRAPDYDDWNLNGDLLIWSDLLSCPVEISSMGIRVDAQTLQKQLAMAGCEEKANLPFHKMVLNHELPLTMGGGIGISRISMLLLEKAHIGEVQASVWPDEVIQECESKGIHLL